MCYGICSLRASFLWQAYGLTEHSCITLTHAQKDSGILHKNSVGFILPNLEVKFVDPDTGRSLPRNTPGELCVRSQCVMQGNGDAICPKNHIIMIIYYTS